MIYSKGGLTKVRFVIVIITCTCLGCGSGREWGLVGGAVLDKKPCRKPWLLPKALFNARIVISAL
jgi:hypothetical protein